MELLQQRGRRLEIAGECAAEPHHRLEKEPGDGGCSGAAAPSSPGFHCTFPGCSKRYVELWRLRQHCRALVHGGHGTELSRCPRCEGELVANRAHLGCAGGLAAPRQAMKRRRLQARRDEQVMRSPLLHVRRTASPLPAAADVAASLRNYCCRHSLDGGGGAARWKAQADPMSPALRRATSTPLAAIAAACPRTSPQTSAPLQSSASWAGELPQPQALLADEPPCSDGACTPPQGLLLAPGASPAAQAHIVAAAEGLLRDSKQPARLQQLVNQFVQAVLASQANEEPAPLLPQHSSDDSTCKLQLAIPPTPLVHRSGVASLAVATPVRRQHDAVPLSAFASPCKPPPPPGFIGRPEGSQQPACRTPEPGGWLQAAPAAQWDGPSQAAAAADSQQRAGLSGAAVALLGLPQSEPQAAASSWAAAVPHGSLHSAAGAAFPVAAYNSTTPSPATPLPLLKAGFAAAAGPQQQCGYSTPASLLPSSSALDLGPLAGEVGAADDGLPLVGDWWMGPDIAELWAADSATGAAAEAYQLYQQYFGAAQPHLAAHYC